jgi:hypothetical protein
MRFVHNSAFSIECTYTFVEQEHSVVSGWNKKHERDSARAGVGTPDRIRTCDLLLRRQALYPLSYGRVIIDREKYTRILRNIRGYDD